MEVIFMACAWYCGLMFAECGCPFKRRIREGTVDHRRIPGTRARRLPRDQSAAGGSSSTQTPGGAATGQKNGGSTDKSAPGRPSSPTSRGGSK
jgi:hypothetical protein